MGWLEYSENHDKSTHLLIVMFGIGDKFLVTVENLPQVLSTCELFVILVLYGPILVFLSEIRSLDFLFLEFFFVTNNDTSLKCGNVHVKFYFLLKLVFLTVGFFLFIILFFIDTIFLFNFLQISPYKNKADH